MASDSPKKGRYLSFAQAKRLLEIILLLFNVVQARRFLTEKDKIAELRRVIKILVAFVNDLEVIKDCSNSSIPSSKCFPGAKAKKPRKKSEKKPGGQEGHKGVTYDLDPEPKRTEICQPKEIEEIIRNPYIIPIGNEVRQERELIVDAESINYLNISYRNTQTGEIYKGNFPDHIKAPFQYGLACQSALVLLRIGNYVPYGRGARYLEEIGGPSVGRSTFINICKRAANSPVLKYYKEASVIYLRKSRYVHADETGSNVAGLLIWIFFCGADRWVRFMARRGRGMVDINECGILPDYHGIIVHDCYRAYFNYGGDHALCLAHLLRDLQAAIDKGSNWAIEMKDLLQSAIKNTENCGGVLNVRAQNKLRDDYNIILIGAKKENARLLQDFNLGKTGVKPGRVAKPTSVNLYERFDNYKEYILNFTHIEYIPPTNNFAEQSLRPLKLHLNNSKCFRTMRMAEEYCDLMGYLMTCERHGMASMEAVNSLLENKIPPFILEIIGDKR
jgi:transposase